MCRLVGIIYAGLASVLLVGPVFLLASVSWTRKKEQKKPEMKKITIKIKIPFPKRGDKKEMSIASCMPWVITDCMVMCKRIMCPYFLEFLICVGTFGRKVMVMWEYGEAIHATFVAHGAANSVARNRSLALSPRDVVAGAHLCYWSFSFLSLLPFIFSFMYWSICDITGLLASCGSTFMLSIIFVFHLLLWSQIFCWILN